MAKKDSNGNPIGTSRGLRRSSSGTADWVSADAATLHRAVATATNAGGALRFGYTRDGGAYNVGIYGDGEPYTEYIRPDEDIDQVLRSIIELFESIKDTPMNKR